MRTPSGKGALFGAHALDNDNANHKHHADYVGELARDHHAQTAGGNQDAEQRVHGLIQVAVQSRGHTEQAGQEVTTMTTDWITFMAMLVPSANWNSMAGFMAKM